MDHTKPTVCPYKATQFQLMGIVKQAKVKVNVMWIYIAPSRETLGVQAWITQFYMQPTPCLPLRRKRSPDDATTDCGQRHLIADYYSFIEPKKMKG